MSHSRRDFIRSAALLAGTIPLAQLARGETGRPAVAGPAGGMPLREVLFSPGNLTERLRCFDRFELLRKPAGNPVMRAERPWEGAGGINWGSVLRSEVDGKYRFFYATDFPGRQEGAVLVDNSMQGRNHCVVCYAESDDGLSWRRPTVNRFFRDQFPDNNIVLAWPSYYNDSPSVIEDRHDPDPRRRFKLMMFHLDISDRDRTGCCLFVSPDGLAWEFTGTVLPSQDASSLWQDPRTGTYYAFLKDRLGNQRSRLLARSDDFVHWSEPQWIITPDASDSAGTNFYNQCAFVLSGRSLGFLNVYDVSTQTTWIELVESGDNQGWHRMPTRPRLLQPGPPGTYDSGGTYVGLAPPILVGDEYRYYYYASADRHDAADVGGNPAMRPCLAYATFPKDRLVGQQTEQDGAFATLPFVCPGGRLYLNCSSRDPVRVAIKRPGYGAEYAGFGLNDCRAVTGDSLRHEIGWKDHLDLEALKGKYIRLHVSGRNLIAYSAGLAAVVRT
ncbi:MAG: hypothetical protein JSR48_06995 [Verrucomicrobia bacterium]|nr:hypothetical protein [Verrucomicrobiota bacterium]